MQFILKYVPLISPVLVILGWIIVNIQNNRRETRKEVRSVLDSIYDNLDRLSEDSISFHTNHWNDIKARGLTAKIERTISSINTISEILDISCKTENKELRQSITLKNFDRSSHTRLSGEEDQITMIYDSVFILSSKLENRFIEKYLSSKLWLFL